MFFEIRSEKTSLSTYSDIANYSDKGIWYFASGTLYRYKLVFIPHYNLCIIILACPARLYIHNVIYLKHMYLRHNIAEILRTHYPFSPSVPRPINRPSQFLAFFGFILRTESFFALNAYISHNRSHYRLELREFP